MSDVAHCGECGKGCGAGEACEEGSCREVPNGDDCTQGLTDCTGTCVDTDSDGANCGTCGKACDDGLICESGECMCPGGASLCDAACIDLQTDEAHCGTCDLACASLPHTESGSSCDGGQCAFSCTSGYGDCDEDWKTGCEADFENDTANCGGCGTDCDSLEGIDSAFCFASSCHVLTCAAGREDCDGYGSNGCEIDTNSDLKHCGACNALCDATAPNVGNATCDAGACILTCANGYEDCDGIASNGCEALLENDSANCGSCGKTCAQTCSAGQCVDVVSLATGSHFACAALDGGPVACWGSNASGELGNGVASASEPQPTLVKDLQGVSQLSAGADFACAIRADRSLVCWGSNAKGQLGNGVGSGTSDRPVVVSGLSGVEQVSVAGWTACAVAAGGKLYCWGSNSEGVVGDGTFATRSAPVQVTALTKAIVQVSVGAGVACARDVDGGAYCWGTSAWNSGFFNSHTLPVPIPGLAKVVEVAAGGLHGCFLTEAQEVYCGGLNANGQIGSTTNANLDAPRKVAGLAGVRSVAAAAASSCAILGEGDVWCWGHNDSHQLGVSTPAQRESPAKLSGLSGIFSVSGRDKSFCALGVQGVACWGKNTAGVLGVEADELEKSAEPKRIHLVP